MRLVSSFLAHEKVHKMYHTKANADGIPTKNMCDSPKGHNCKSIIFRLTSICHPWRGQGQNINIEIVQIKLYLFKHNIHIITQFLHFALDLEDAQGGF